MKARRRIIERRDSEGSVYHIVQKKIKILFFWSIWFEEDSDDYRRMNGIYRPWFTNIEQAEGFIKYASNHIVEEKVVWEEKK